MRENRWQKAGKNAQNHMLLWDCREITHPEKLRDVKACRDLNSQSKHKWFALSWDRVCFLVIVKYNIINKIFATESKQMVAAAAGDSSWSMSQCFSWSPSLQHSWVPCRRPLWTCWMFRDTSSSWCTYLPQLSEERTSACTTPWKSAHIPLRMSGFSPASRRLKYV